MDAPHEFVVGQEDAGRRLDAVLADRLDASRAVLRRAIDAGEVRVDGETRKPSLKLAAGQRVVVARLAPPPPGPEPEPIPLDLLYEDDHLIVVNKPAGMIVHPARGHWSGTLASALAHHFGEGLSSAAGATRPGIVHRLDRDTSGVIVVAKHDRAHERLAAQFKDRTTDKQYLAIVLGVPDRDADLIDRPIGPHPTAREKMAIREGHPDSRDAVTRYETIERFHGYSLVRCTPKTGRTHQIRVHMAHAGHAVLCDKLYGGRSRVTAAELSGNGPSGDPILERQALHAHRLSINHPATAERLAFEAPIPNDINAALRCLWNPDE